MKPAVFRWMMNLYVPFLGAGVHIERINDDYTEIDVRMRLTRFNRNYVGTQFGGSLYSMTDPFYMLMLMQHLAKDHVVWDQAAHIDFVSPGRGTVYARFRLSVEQIADFRAQAATGKAIRPVLLVEVVNAAGEVVARVQKTLYIRLKPALRPPAAAEISAPTQPVEK